MSRHCFAGMPVVGAVALAASMAGICAPPAQARTGYHVVATEVAVGSRIRNGAGLRDELLAASVREAGYYDAALPSARMRITIDKLKTRSAGKALASGLPIVGMFAGTNENRLRGRVELFDPVTGRVLKKARIDCDDNTQFSAADGMVALAEIGTSFLPFGGLFSLAADVGRSAATRQASAQHKLVRGFVMLSFKKLYGGKTYASFAPRRKADLVQADVPVKVDAQPAAGGPVPAVSPAPPATPAA